MHFLYYFAGWPQCTSSEYLRKKIAGIIALVIIGVGVYLIVQIIKKISKTKHNINIKQLLGVAAILGGSVVTLLVAFFAAFAIAPWCS